MQLQNLLQQAGIAGGDSRIISDIASDSRQVRPGALFAVISGTKIDGAQYIADAIARGAVALLVEQGAQLPEIAADIALIKVDDIRLSVARIAAIFFAPQPQYIVAVTGTDGKTSTAEFARQFFAGAGAAAASIGTLGLTSSLPEIDAKFPANNTSPEPILLHRTLQQLAAQNLQHVAIEASSHGLDQQRLSGLKLQAAAFTNLSRDHLDYHGNLEAYFAAKAKLFAELLPEGATAVLNADSPQFAQLRDIALQRKLQLRSYGKVGVDYQIIDLQPHSGGIYAALQIEGQMLQMQLPVYGGFQLYNMLAAYGLARSCNFASETLLPQFTKIRGVRGRLERVALHQSGAAMFIDYAHTPAALENILHTLRAHTENKLHVVFGCGGDRDAGKRPQMGAVAARLADNIIITDDNPRSENPELIRAAIAQAAPTATVIADRAEAINAAMANLQVGDVLVVAGKGHENYQIVGEQTLHFDDAEVIRAAVGATNESMA